MGEQNQISDPIIKFGSDNRFFVSLKLYFISGSGLIVYLNIWIFHKTEPEIGLSGSNSNLHLNILITLPFVNISSFVLENLGVECPWKFQALQRYIFLEKAVNFLAFFSQSGQSTSDNDNVSRRS